MAMGRRVIRFWFGAAVAAVAALSGCSRFRHAANAPDKPAAGPTDGNLTAMLMAANNTDISYAKLVPERTPTLSVRDFATRMITDHAAVNTAINELVARTTIKPEENAASLSFRDRSTAERAALSGLYGRQFDSAYIANEIAYHTSMIASVDNDLLPHARDAQLRQILVSVRPALAAHLAHAQQVQSRLR